MKPNVKNTFVTDLTEGSVTGLLIRFAFPLFISNLLQALYNLVDMVVVGQFIGGEGMSAVSIGGDVLHLLTFVAMGFSSAGQVLIAKDVGAGRMDKVRKMIGTMFTTLLGISILISVICYFLRDQILKWLNTPAEAFNFAMDYMITCIIGLVFIYGYNIVSAILRGVGDSKRPFVFIAIAAVLNTALDLLFVIVFDMKVFGAALATVIAQGASFMISLVYLYIRRDAFGFDFKPKDLIPERESWKSLTLLGVPMAIQSASVNFSKIILTSWINLSGVTYSALSALYNKLNLIIGVVSNAFMTAGASMVGQNLGAKKIDRIPKILRTIAFCSIIVTILLSAVLVLWPEPTFRLFTGDETVLAVAVLIIGPCIVNFFGCATRSVAFSLINGSGRTALNFAVAIIDGMICRIGIAALLGFLFKLGCKGFLYGDAIAGFCPILIGMAFYLSGSWKKGIAVNKEE